MLGPPGGIPAGIQMIEFAKVWLAGLCHGRGAQPALIWKEGCIVVGVLDGD